MVCVCVCVCACVCVRACMRMYVLTRNYFISPLSLITPPPGDKKCWVGFYLSMDSTEDTKGHLNIPQNTQDT